MNRIPVAPGFFLNVEVAGSGPPLVLLHGFTGSAASWAPFIEALGGGFTTIAIDIVGHGHSDKPAPLDRYRMRQAASDLVRAAGRAGFPRAHWMGYSMGGRIALAVAAYHPGSVERLVLVGASPGLPTEEERAARRNSDEAIAQHIETDGIPAFVRYWERLPIFATQARLPAGITERIRSERLANHPVGLANSLRGMGTGSQEPLFDRLPGIANPALLLAGVDDSKYVAIGREMAAAMPAARFVSVPAAGHAAQTENPGFCAAEVIAFLTGAGPRGRTRQ